MTTNPLYQGRCHCGGVRFEARIDPAARRMAHCFCRHCGVHPFAKGREAERGGAFYVVRMRGAHEYLQL